MDKFSLGTEAMRDTVGAASKILGGISLLALVIYTASHAINLVGHNANFGQDNPLAPILYFGIAVVELLAMVTAVQVMTHQLRAGQKAAAIGLEVTWVAFAAVNLIASFAIDHNQVLPQLVQKWVTYGLPVSALVVGIEYYLVLRINPDAKRIDDQKELDEMFQAIEHNAEIEVLMSDQTKVVVRQMKWQTLPDTLGQRLGLSQQQIDYIKRHAPQLFDGNGDGIGDVLQLPQEPRQLPTPSPNGRVIPLAAQSPTTLSTEVEPIQNGRSSNIETLNNGRFE